MKDWDHRTASQISPMDWCGKLLDPDLYRRGHESTLLLGLGRYDRVRIERRYYPLPDRKKDQTAVLDAADMP
jgi:hypothetical protein